MADDGEDRRDGVGAWAKKYHLAARALMESVLREHGLGPTQWYVLHQLVHVGPTIQRDLGPLLNIERATLSGVVTTLVRKGFVEQRPDVVDQRQRLLSLTDRGRELWDALPDPVALAQRISFADADPEQLAVAREVLRQATQRLVDHMGRSG
ncbi:MarR family winged helix-turn-helix transcriptional regulator [Angustibacter aerolatus]